MKRLFTMALALVALGSCSNEQIDTNAPVEVKMNAKVTATKAVINAGDAVTGVQFARIDGDTPAWTSVTAVTTTGDIAKTSGAITFTNPQFYPSTDGMVNFVGYFPAAKSIAAGVVSMEITGDEDVLYAAPVAGNKTNKLGSMAFNHMLTQFTFVIVKEASVSPDVTGVEVAIKDAKTTFDMALADGVLDNWAGAKAIPVITGGTATITPSTATVPFMIEPDMTSLVLTVSADGYASQPITILGSDNGKFEKGSSYVITLTFKATSIEPTSTISAWKPGTATGGDVQ